MSDSELIGRVRNSMRRQCQERGYAAPVDTLIEIGALPEKKHLAWRYGQVPYLEKVCVLNLRELNVVLKEMNSYAAYKEWKPSWCCYKQWGCKKEFGHKRPVVPLCFSKSGDPVMEKRYSTHYVDRKRIAELKAQKASGS